MQRYSPCLNMDIEFFKHETTSLAAKDLHKAVRDTNKSVTTEFFGFSCCLAVALERCNFVGVGANFLLPPVRLYGPKGNRWTYQKLLWSMWAALCFSHLAQPVLQLSSGCSYSCLCLNSALLARLRWADLKREHNETELNHNPWVSYDHAIRSHKDSTSNTHLPEALPYGPAQGIRTSFRVWRFEVHLAETRRCFC